MTFWQELETELARWSREAPASLWWRDDDTALPAASLDRLLGLSADAEAPLALAVVPRDLSDALVPVLASTPSVTVIQHGYAHVNHAPVAPRAGAWELGGHRPAAVVLGELADGRERLRQRFGARFRPVLAPPWNRIDAALVPLLPAAGYVGLTGFGPRQSSKAAAGLVQVNTHYDPIAWRRGRAFSGLADAASDLIGHLRQRRQRTVDGDEATGILTHHWALDAAAWDFLEALIPTLARHPHVRLLSADVVFG